MRRFLGLNYVVELTESTEIYEILLRQPDAVRPDEVCDVVQEFVGELHVRRGGAQPHRLRSAGVPHVELTGEFPAVTLADLFQLRHRGGGGPARLSAENGLPGA